MTGGNHKLWSLGLSIFLLVSVAAGVTVLSGTAAAAGNAPTTADCDALSWTTQQVSGETYYEVDSLDELQCIENQGLDSNYVLTGDIDASETADWNGDSGFDPIGDKNDEFTGTFDGNGYTITGLTIDRGGTYSVGLFSELASGGTITSVGLEGGSVTGARRTGQLAGFNDGTVEDSHVTGEVTGTERVGGLVGRNDGTVRRSYTSGEPTRGTDWVGGLVGFNQGMIERSFAARAVVGEGGGFDGASAGGLVGAVSTGTIVDSYATGPVTASWFVSGLLGSYQADDGGTIRRSYATGALSIGDESQGIGGIVGGSAVSDTTVENAYWDVGTTNEASRSGQPIDTVTGVNGFGATADTAPAPEMQGASAEANMDGLDFTSTWETVESGDAGAVADGYPILQALDRTVQLRAQGNTPETAPTTADCTDLSWSTQQISGETYNEVDSLYKLQCIENQGLGTNYVLTGDIDASPTADWNGGSGFDPIGDENNEFDGTFDGNGHTISGLTIDRPGTDNVGLFSAVGSGGTITNVALEEGNVIGDYRVGQLVGLNYGTIEDSAATGPTSGYRNVGGLVGRNDGAIRRSSATGQSTSESMAAGGLVGKSFGTIDRSAATGAVVADMLAGGLVGHNEGTIADSYATGTVTAGYTAGGLVGKNTGSRGGFGTIRRSYATGAATASESDAEAGGLAGRNERPDGDGTIETSYWDVGTTGQDRAGGDGGILTDNAGFGSVGDSAPAAAATGDSVYDSMPALDFDATWAVTTGYPRLQWESVDALAVDSLAATTEVVDVDEGATITVTATDSTDSPVEGVTIEVTNADGLSGLSGEAVTDENGEATLSFTERTADDYSPELAWKYDDEVGETVTTTTTVTVESSGGPSIEERKRQQDERPPTADAGANRTVEPGEVVVLDGSNSSDDLEIDRYRWDYTSDGTIEGNLARKQTVFDRPGNYTATLAVEDVVGKTDTDTVSITVRNASASNQSTPAQVAVTSQNGTAGWTATVSNASAGQPVDVTVDDAEDGTTDEDGQAVTVSRLRISVNRESDFTLDVTTSDTPPDSDTDDSEAHDFADETGAQAVGYVRVDHTVHDEHVEDVTFTVDVPKSRLDGGDADPGSMALYRDETDRWNRLPTAVVGETDTHYTVEATSPGLSVFAIASPTQAVAVTDTQVSATTVEAGESASVTVSVANRGSASGAFRMNLTANGSVVAAESVTVAANATRTITLEPVFETAGTYALALDGQSLGTVTVERAQPTSVSTTAQPTQTRAPAATSDSATPSEPESAASTEQTTTSASGAGFGFTVVLLAVVICGLLARLTLPDKST